MSQDFSITIGGNTPRPLVMRSPVMSAAGTFGYGVEYARMLDLSRVGAIVTKSTTARPRAGAPMPRWIETPSGMLNAVGLHNPGIGRVLREYAPRWDRLGVPVVLSIAGESIEEYVAIAGRAEEAEGIAGLELNISCPNQPEGGVWFGTDRELAASVTAAVRGVTSLPLIVKLTPSAVSVPGVATAVEAAGADAVALVNTITGMVINPDTRRPALGNGSGGLSGPAIRPIAVRLVWEVAQVVSVPVIGLGGVTLAEDALQFIMAGATAVQVGSASFSRPDTILNVVNGLADWMDRHGVGSLEEIRGCALPGRTAVEQWS
ncbi:MAG: dihydroorotate dehydrogenase [Chloroflexota bacterium]|nr:dihydroorotate dehydrogenase [Chloroflexota bacterium]